MTLASWVNGEPVSLIALDDRGLQYGDGVFETMAVFAGRIGLLDLHLRRLTESCERLRIPLAPVARLTAELNAAASGQQRAVLKLIVTRGSSGRGYRAPVSGVSNRIVTLHAWPSYPENWWHDGIRVRICKTILSRNPLLAGLKHLNRLEQVMARSEWSEAEDVQEGLMTDSEGAVIEGTMTHLFARLADGELVTPSLDACGVDGVMRRHILEQAVRAKISIRTGKLTLQELATARELFVCN